MDNQTLYDWAYQILFSEKMENKLRSFNDNLHLGLLDPSFFKPIIKPVMPGRLKEHQFSSKQYKFPKKNKLDQKENLAIAMHAFANHELLAIELMALAILVLPHETLEEKKWKIGIVQSLKEEQEHFKMYVGRMQECGFTFGAFPLSGFFWERANQFTSFAQYCAIMSLTLEAANLDFAHYYANVFRELNDFKTASILEKVLEDEITHVKFGVRLLNKLKNNQPLFDYYQSLLPFPLTPARAKGIDFQESLRFASGLDQSFIDAIKTFDDEFKITKRRNNSI